MSKKKKIILIIFAISTLFSVFCCGYIYNNTPLRTAIFRSFAKGNLYMISEQDTLYVFGYAGVQKYLVSDPDNPILLAENDEFCKNCFVGHLVGRSGVVNGDYLYVACRSYLGGPDTSSSDGYVNGKMLIMRKADLSIVKEYVSDIKLIECKQMDSLLVVSGLYGFDVYNVKNPCELKSVYKYRQNKFTEFQGVDFIDKDSLRYVAFSRFAEGVSLWEITDSKDIHPIWSYKFSDTLSNGRVFEGCPQSFKLQYKEPYLYATFAPQRNTFGSNVDRRGILVFDMSDINSIKTSAVTIPAKDYYSIETGDPEPSHLMVYGDSLCTNFGEKGIAIFDISIPATPVYRGYKDAGNNGNMILPLHINHQGLIFTGDYYWNDIYNYKIN